MNSGNLLGRKQGANSSKMDSILEDKALLVTGLLFQNGRAFFNKRSFSFYSYITN
jgi:hypothetical protein